MKPSPRPFLNNEERATLKSAEAALLGGGLSFGEKAAVDLAAAIRTALLADEAGVEFSEAGPPITASRVLELSGLSFASVSGRSDLLRAVNEGLTNAFERGLVEGKERAALEAQAAAALPLLPPAVLVSLMQSARNALGVLGTVEAYRPFEEGSLGALDLKEALDELAAALEAVCRHARGEK